MENFDFNVIPWEKPLLLLNNVQYCFCLSDDPARDKTNPSKLRLKCFIFPIEKQASVYYHPQTKFAKVMFLYLFVILFTGGV